MEYKKISNSEYEKLPSLIEQNYNCTITEIRKLNGINGLYRMILVSEDSQMLFLTTGQDVLALDFQQISNVDREETDYNVGKRVKAESSLNWGAAALGAMAGWMVISTKTKTKIVDNIIKLYYIKFSLTGNHDEPYSYYMCKDLSDAIAVSVIINSLIDKYNTTNDDLEVSAAESTPGASALLFFVCLVLAPVLGFWFHSWLVFFLCLGLAVFFLVQNAMDSDDDYDNSDPSDVLNRDTAHHSIYKKK